MGFARAFISRIAAMPQRAWMRATRTVPRHGEYRPSSKCGFTAGSPARSANWPLTTAVSEANETVNRGAATPWFLKQWSK